MTPRNNPLSEPNMHFATYGNHHHLLCCSGHTKCACPLLSLWARKILQYPCKDYSTGTLFICWQKLLQKDDLIKWIPFCLFLFHSLILNKVFSYLLIAKCLSWHLLKLIPMWTILIIEIDFFSIYENLLPIFPMYMHAQTIENILKLTFRLKRENALELHFV